MKFIQVLFPILVVGMCCVTTSCDKDEEKYSGSLEQTQTPPTSNISQPTFEKNLTTTTISDVSMRCRFNNGGDTGGNMSCTVHWNKYYSKPTTTPKASDMTNHEQMRQYASTSETTTFDKTHTGFSGGMYIYYYFECKNSKFTTKTDVTYCVVKR